jgi:3-hydroxymyristoyl/3-hydroxydecanoyl-(acyl carrier protein) dehydratase
MSAPEVLSSAADGPGWRLVVRLPPLPEPGPLFEGHFPGHPILPGVVHLALVARALADWQGRGAALRAVRSLKLRRPVGPGETLSVRLAPGEGGVRFTIESGEREGEPVSRGTVVPVGEERWP